MQSLRHLVRIFDFYWFGFASQKIYDSYLRHFFETRNAIAEIDYVCYSLPTPSSFFEENPNADISQFKGEIGLLIRPNIDDIHTDPRIFREVV